MLKGKKGKLREEKEISNISSDSSGYDESWVQSTMGPVLRMCRVQPHNWASQHYY